MTGHVNVLILGYGEMGKAMVHMLRENPSINVDVWDKYPEPDFVSANLEDSATIADIVLCCLPVSPYREVLNTITPMLRKNTLCIGLAKGLDVQGLTAAQIFSDALGDNHYALLYGPMISEEIRADRYAFAQVLCNNLETYERVRNLFSHAKIHLSQSSDLVGASWAAILKNVYALLFGITDELNLGDNVRGYLASACLQELDKIVCRMGGRAGTAYQWAGLGDLITTATSSSSHHYSLGRQLARGDESNISGEGVHTLAMIEQHRLLTVKDYPLLECVMTCVKWPKNTGVCIKELLLKEV